MSGQEWNKWDTLQLRQLRQQTKLTFILSVLWCILVEVPAMATKGGENTLNSAPEEFLCDCERELLSNVRINQEMMKPLGIVKQNDLLKTLFLCVYGVYAYS